MQKVVYLLICLLLLAPLSGCIGGNDDEPVAEEPNESLDEWLVHYAQSVSDLPTCDSNSMGRLYYVENISEFRVCKSTGWAAIDVTGPQGQDGADGDDGSNGQDGDDGMDGDDGITPLIRVSNSTACLNGGQTFEIGQDLDGDGSLSVSEITSVVDICNGSDGQDGSDGQAGDSGSATWGENTTMVTTSEELAGDNCSSGGVAVHYGMDENNNQILDAAEILSTTYVCNASITQTLLLTSVSTAPAHLNCDAGSRVIAHGLDNGDGDGVANNGVLEAGEHDASTTYCSFTYSATLRDEAFSSAPEEFITIGDLTYFLSGYELWRTDGTQLGTYGLGVTLSSYDSGCFSETNGLLIFAANSRAWMSDGSVEGTVQLTNSSVSVRCGGGYYAPLGMERENFAERNGEVFFMATYAQNGVSMWKTDGSPSGTVEVSNLSGQITQGPYFLVGSNSGVYFYARADTGNGTQDYVIFKYNPASSNLSVFLNYGPSPAEDDFLFPFASMGNFTLMTPGESQNRLLCTDGSTVGTVEVFSSNTSAILPYIRSPVSDVAFFMHNDTIWETDCTLAGTRQISHQLNHSLSAEESLNYNIFKINGEYIFWDRESPSNDCMIYKKNLTENSTYLLTIQPFGATWYQSFVWAEFEGQLYFSHTDDSGRHLWHYDPTNDELSLHRNPSGGPLIANPLSYHPTPNGLFVVTQGNYLYSTGLVGVSVFYD